MHRDNHEDDKAGQPPLRVDRIEASYEDCANSGEEERGETSQVIVTLKTLRHSQGKFIQVVIGPDLSVEILKPRITQNKEDHDADED